MTKQTQLANEARDKGMKQAIDSALRKDEYWMDKAMQYTKWYTETVGVGKTFMTEDIREWSGVNVPEPPSLRAWGAVARLAAKIGLIEKVGFSETKNIKSHRTPARVWKVKSKSTL